MRKNHFSLPFYFSRVFFWMFGLASVVVLPIYFFYSTSIYIPLTFSALLVLMALVDLLAVPSPRKIRMSRPISYPLVVDKANLINLEVVNGSRHRISLIIQDDIPLNCTSETWPLQVTTEPGNVMIKYKLTPLERGNAYFGNIHFWIKGPLGLIWRHGECAAETRVKLYPGLALIEKRRMKLWRASADYMMRPIRKKGQGTEFDSLRDYVEGEDTRLIHWTATARRGKLIVRQNRMEKSQTVFLVLDAGRMMTARVHGKTKFEHSLNSALLLAYGALEVGDKVGLMVVGQDVLCLIPPANAFGQFGLILDSTYALEPRMEEARFHFALTHISAKLKKRSLVVVFTDLIDERASKGLKRYIRGLLPRHLPLVAAVSDPEVVRLADEKPASERDLYRQGVASEILERRDHLLADLVSAGMLVIDCPPTQISEVVFDKYLEIKTRGLL